VTGKSHVAIHCQINKSSYNVYIIHLKREVTMRTISSAEAQNHFGLLLDTAQREPVSITRRGRPVAYLVSPQDYIALTQGNKNSAAESSAVELLAAFRGSGIGGAAARLVADRETERQQET
jgi:prevent-host-death family protein